METQGGKVLSRIETLDDLIKWLDSLVILHTKNVSVEKLSDDEVHDITGVREKLVAIAVRFPGTFKQCHRCKAIYPETEEWFDYSGQGRTGLHATCKFCRNAYQKKRKRTKRPGQPRRYGSQSDLDEINSHRSQDGLPLLSG